MELTPRETALCELMRLGLTNKEIATRMQISDKTVEVHVHNLKLKAGYSARALWAASLLRSSVQSGS